jgi:ribosome-associated translation inhibitor RaiA
MITVRVAKLAMDVDFTTEQLPPASLQYLLTYGATQAVNDSAASIVRKNFETDTAFADAVAEKVQKRIDQIKSGDVPGSRAPTDPKMAKLRAVVKAAESDPKMAAALDKIFAELAKQAA